MVRVSLRMPEELHEKLRLLAFHERRSQHEILLEIVEKGLKHVQVPKEAKKHE